MKTPLDEFVNWFINEYKSKCIDVIDNKPELISEMLHQSLKETILQKIKPQKIENINDLAKLLDGNYCMDELENPYNINVNQLCKEKRWVIFFPYSDDNIEIRGYINDEIGAYDGTNLLFYKKGDFYPENLDEETFKKASEDMFIALDDDLIYDTEVEDGRIGISMKWEPNDKAYIWYITSKYEKVAYFDIHDEDNDGEMTWAHCCIIDLN